MEARPFLSVIIPAYNEAERITATLVDIDRILSAKKYSYEILVMNDGSKDATGATVRALEGRIKNLHLVDNAHNQGKGGVVKQGMLRAKGEYRLFMDADNSTSVDQFDHMVPLFEQGYAVVIGSRAMKGSLLQPPEPWYRQLPGKMGNIVIQLLLAPGIWDTQCGFKGYRADAAEKIFGATRIMRWGFDAETIALAKRFGFRIKEIPVRWVNDIRSHVGLKAYLQVLIETITIRWWLWTGKYPSVTQNR